MENKPLVEIFGDKAALSGQVDHLEAAISKYREIPKFFGAYLRPIGLEFEMENCAARMHAFSKQGIYWRATEDGSLRNSGIEMISLPLSGHNIDYALHEMEQFLKESPDTEASIRTSIHVHTDVSDWGVRDLYSLPAFYALFEPLLFSLQSERRIGNPYCYEITDLFPRQIDIDPGMKYCALNLAPAQTQLSVEWRHADFSTDMRKNRRWIQVVCKMMHYADKHKETMKEDLLRIICSDDYLKLFYSVMGKSAPLFAGDIQEMMKRNALWSATFLELI